jgi:hypothetical protein
MNEVLKQRILRHLETLPDERGYQVLDYVEFLESRFAERASPSGLFARISETVEDTMRAGRLPIQAITGTMSVVDSAGKVMKGLAAAGRAVVEEAVKAAGSSSPTVPPPPATPRDLPAPDAPPPASRGQP